MRAATPTVQSAPGEITPSTVAGPRQPLERRLVVGRDDGALVGVLEPDRLRVAIGGDHVEPAPVGRLEQPELRRTGA